MSRDRDRSPDDKAPGEDEAMCWPTDWFQEDLPLEDRESTALDRQLEARYNESISVPGICENFARAPKSLQPLHFAAPDAPQRESILVFSDADGVCRRILDAAPEGRVGTRKVVEDCAQLSQEEVSALLSTHQGGWDLIIYGYGMDAPRSNGVNSVIDQQDSSACLYFWLLQEIHRMESSTTRLAVITRGVFTEDPGQHRKYGVQLLTGALLFGMSNSARLEMDIRIQYIDTEWSLGSSVSDPHKLLPRLASEVFRQQTFGHNSVRMLNAGRYVLRRVPSKDYEAACREFELPQHGTIAISGGNGALGLVLGGYLLDLAEKRGEGGFSMQFLSRSAKVPDGNLRLWESVQTKAQRLAIPVVQTKCDVSNSVAVDAFLREMRGGLTGFIHSAGLMRDAMLANLTWERFDAVFAPKHRAALYLHGALDLHKNPDLKFFWLFSCSSVFGVLGQINYSGSNACLDALARHRAGRGRPCLAIQWGSWKEVGMAMTLREELRRRVDAGPEPYFTNREALSGLEAGLRTGLPGFSVLKFNQGVLREALRGADTAVQCYQRNFQCEVVPLPPTAMLERHHVYTVLRESQGTCAETGRRGLVYGTYTEAFIEEEEREWGDDFRKWTK